MQSVPHVRPAVGGSLHVHIAPESTRGCVPGHRRPTPTAGTRTGDRCAVLHAWAQRRDAATGPSARARRRRHRTPPLHTTDPAPAQSPSGRRAERHRTRPASAGVLAWLSHIHLRSARAPTGAAFAHSRLPVNPRRAGADPPCRRTAHDETAQDVEHLVAQRRRWTREDFGSNGVGLGGQTEPGLDDPLALQHLLVGTKIPCRRCLKIRPTELALSARDRSDTDGSPTGGAVRHQQAGVVVTNRYRVRHPGDAVIGLAGQAVRAELCGDQRSHVRDCDRSIQQRHCAVPCV